VSVFLTDDLELRGGWRFAVYVLTYILLFLVTGMVMSAIMPGPVNFGDLDGLLLNVLTFLPPAILAFLFMLRFVDKRPLAAFGVTLNERWAHDLILGLLVAAGMMAVFGIGTALLGAWVWNSAAGGSTSRILATTVLLAVAAANEELVYRGYPLQALIGAIGPPGAVCVMSVLFGFGHYLNPNATWLAALNVSLAGALLSIAYLRTRALWLPYGIHIGWNVLTGVLFGLPVSGVRLNSFRRPDIVGADWVTGGAFGPEGGILATIAIIAAAVVLGRTRRAAVSPTVRAALSEKLAPR
jgi:membrane protease YdiL (CAAX protease family)